MGFLLLALVTVRAARRRLGPADLALLAGGVVFAPVKYLGIFLVPVAAVAILWLRRDQVRAHFGAAMGAAGAILLLALATSWHYYVHHVIAYGSPFYPVQINLGPIHLPGLADLSDTSIMYNLRNPELWRLFFLPASGVSVAGLIFPLILAGTLLLTTAQCVRAAFRWLRRRTPPGALDMAAFLILCGWMLYFRSALGAGGTAGDLRFVRSDLNSLRYAIGVLAASELYLAALFPRIAPSMGGRQPGEPPGPVVQPDSRGGISLDAGGGCGRMCAGGAAGLAPRFRAALCVAALVIACPFLVQRNRVLWTPYWNDLKPALDRVRGQGLAILAFADGGYFAGHVVAAGNPVDPAVRALSAEQIEAMAPAQRPAYLAVLCSPGSAGETTWRSTYAPDWARWGYVVFRDGKSGVLLRETK